MISVTELRAGTIYEDSGDLLQVQTYEHIKVGRGSANIKVKVRNLRSGAMMEKSFISGAMVRDVHIQNKEMQYLYKDASDATFMDPVSFEQLSIPLKQIPGNEYLIDGNNATIQFYQEEPLGLQLPPKVTLKVMETDPGVKGNSASNVYKDAVLENGVKARVPLFIEEGDSVVVDTRDGSYTKRA